MRLDIEQIMKVQLKPDERLLIEFKGGTKEEDLIKVKKTLRTVMGDQADQVLLYANLGIKRVGPAELTE